MRCKVHVRFGEERQRNSSTTLCLLLYLTSKAKATLAGIELWSMIKNGQLDNPDGLSVWGEFYALAA